MSADSDTPRYHRIFLASAGTGKTYRLSGRFLDLLLAGAEPRSILATTFTRKAAGEILDRVLERLVEAVDDDDKRAELVVDRDFGGAFEAADALTLLADLVRHLDRFEVRTLDSFFVHLGRLFALDLDLAPQWSVAAGPEIDEVTADALAQLLEDVKGPEAEAEFAEILRAIKPNQGAGRSVHGALTDLVKKGRDVFLDTTAEAWGHVQPGEGLTPEKRDGLLGDLEKLKVPLTQAETPNQTWKNNKDNLRDLLKAEDWIGLLGVGLVGKVRDKESKFSRVTIAGDWVEFIQTVLTEIRHQVLCGLVIRNAHAVALLSRYETFLQGVKRERGLYEFSDIPRALAPPAPGTPSPIAARDLNLAFRLDAQLHHLLLDEFQDTAPIQWRVLAETAENICADVSGDQSFFCVGDVKQAIYRWRSAEPRLLSTLGEHLNVENEALRLNYRSSAVILNTVNQTFEGLSELPVFATDGKAVHRAAAQIFESEFGAHEASEPRPGAAELHQARLHVDGEKDWMPVIDLAAARVQALAAAEPLATIGVLMRSNTHIPRLIVRLQNAGLPVSGEGGNQLTDSAAVLHFLSLLHLADHPSDSMAAFHLSASPMPAVLGIENVLDEPHDLARRVRERLMTRGLGRLCADLEPCLHDQGSYSEWDLRRYRQLGDLAFAWSERASLRADRFVDWVRAHKVEVPAAARIKVMTVHASKGLEFDAVILPELDGTLAKNQWRFLVNRPNPRGILKTATLNPSMKVVALDDSLKALFEEQTLREVQEALCVLYVGMTRARYRLEMIVRERRTGDGGACPAGILRNALGTDLDGSLLWRHPDSSDNWFPAPKAGAASAPKPQPLPAGLSLAATTSLRRLPSRSPSAEEGGPTSSGASLMASSTNVGTRFGSVVHRYLEEYPWPTEATLDEATLLPLAIAIEPDEMLRREAFAYLEQALQETDIRAALSAPDKNGAEWEVWCEREFCVVLTDARGSATWRGSFDRVLLQRKNGKLVSAIVQDYKTDKVDADTLESRVDYYTPQLRAYRSALSSMTDLAPEAITAQLLFLGAGIVRDVGP